MTCYSTITGMVFLLFSTVPEFKKNIFCVLWRFPVDTRSMKLWGLGFMLFFMFGSSQDSTYDPMFFKKCFFKSRWIPGTIYIGEYFCEITFPYGSEVYHIITKYMR